MKNNIVVKTKKTGVTARIEGNGGRFEAWTEFSVYDGDEEVYQCVRPTHEQMSTYFGRESSKTVVFVLGLYNIAEDKPAEGYKKNRALGNGWFQMSAYAYKRIGNVIYRTTLDVAAAGGRIDTLQPVARVCKDGKLMLLEKQAKVINSAVRSDSGKSHKKDHSPNAFVEKVRRG